MERAGRLVTLLAFATLLAVGPYFTNLSYAASLSIPSSIEIAVSYADTEGRGSDAGNCANCFPSPWCGSPGVQFIGTSTNYNGNSTDTNNCKGGGWDTGAILVINKGTSPITFTNLTVAFPLPSSGSTVIPTCAAEMRPITFNVWFGQKYYWNNPADPAFSGGQIVVPAGGQAIFAGTSSDNSYHCPTGNYPSIGLTNGTYDFDTSDAYYLDGCTPTTDPSSAPRITFSANGYAATTYNDTGHTIDTGGIDTGNCKPTTVDPQWGHENLGWRLLGTCGESCPTNQLGVATSSSAGGVVTSSISSSSATSATTTSSSTTTLTTSIVSVSSSATTTTSSGGASSTHVTSSGASGGVSATTVYGIVAVVVIFIIAAGYLVMRGRKQAS
jgi:hypothetical protein